MPAITALIFARQAKLYAVRFDPDSLTVSENRFRCSMA